MAHDMLRRKIFVYLFPIKRKTFHLNTHGRAHTHTQSHAFLWSCCEGKPEYPEKIPLSDHTLSHVPTPGIKPESHWWGARSLTTQPTELLTISTEHFQTKCFVQAYFFHVFTLKLHSGPILHYSRRKTRLMIELFVTNEVKAVNN